jgi:uncharacterized membrane protein
MEVKMADTKHQNTACSICGKVFPHKDLISGNVVRDTIANEILADFPKWSSEDFICVSDLEKYRSKYIHSLLESEKGELTTLEKEVFDSMREHELLSKNMETEFEQVWTVGERLADRIASFGGSWSFLIIFFIFISIWIGMNSLVLFLRPVDPYPFILLNLVLSCIAAIQAPVIMMSQNRQEAKDRLRSQHDYQINLKAELEIRHLHEKIDHLLYHQWERLTQIQEIQIELLTEINRNKSSK